MAKHEVEVIHTRVFAAEPGGGNPCPVVLHADHLTDAWKQELARRFGLDTVFVLKPHSSTAAVRLRYFVPDHEMGVSGHATIAAATVGLLDDSACVGRATVETVTGTFPITWARTAGGFAVTLGMNEPRFGPPIPPRKIAAILRIRAEDIVAAGGPIQSVSVSRAKLLVPLREQRVLDSLNPDQEALWRACDALDVTGFYPFTRQTDRAHACTEARQFPLRAGFAEDAATGVAAGALGAYLARYDHRCAKARYEFRIAQGFAMGAPSVIEAVCECEEGSIIGTAIRGSAEIVGREAIHDI